MCDTLTHKVTRLTEAVRSFSVKVDKLSDKSNLTLLAPMIAALTTAVIGTLLAQAIDRIFRNGVAKQNELRESHSKAVNMKIRLKDLFRQLAMYKFHAKYWWHIYTKEHGKEFQDKYYLEHLRSQAEARDTQRKFGEAIGDFLAEVVRFEKLKGKRFNVDREKVAAMERTLAGSS